jgi:molecular chaperone GrpE (heat shock protein)
MNGSQVVRLEFVARSKPPGRELESLIALLFGGSRRRKLDTMAYLMPSTHTELEEKMSMSERSIKGRLALTLGSAMLITATGYTDQEALVNSVGDALTEVNATKSQLAATMSSLNALLATKPGDDLRPAYEAYVDNVDKTKRAAATTQQRVDQMNNDSANYFSSWKSDNDNISNSQLQKVANHRLEQVQKNYANAIASLQAASDKFTPFLSDLSDIQTALSNDLTAKGLKAAKGVFEKANHDHGEVQKEIGTAIRHLTATQLALSPVAGAK